MNLQNEVAMYLDLLWKFLKPVSFSLIGKEVDFSVLEGNMVLYGFVTLLAGVVVSIENTLKNLSQNFQNNIKLSRFVSSQHTYFLLEVI